MLKNKCIFEVITQYNYRDYRLIPQLFNSIKEANKYIKSNVDDRIKYRCRVEKIV